MGLLDILPKSGKKKSEEGPVEKARIVIAEDDRYLNDFYVELLTTEGYEMIPAFDGQQALDLILQSPPHLVILDINMPAMNGEEVLANVRKNDHTKDIPVIMFTNASSIENMTLARTNHANKFFIKANIEPPKLIQAVKDLLSPQAVVWFKEDTRT